MKLTLGGDPEVVDCAIALFHLSVGETRSAHFDIKDVDVVVAETEVASLRAWCDLNSVEVRDSW